MSVFTEKNEARKEGRSTTPREVWKEARTLRKSVGGAFGRQSKQFWQSASRGTAGEAKNGGVGDAVKE